MPETNMCKEKSSNLLYMINIDLTIDKTYVKKKS